MALSDLVDIRVEFGIGGAAGDAIYGTSLYGTGRYGSSVEGNIEWQDFTGQVQSLTTKTGKSLFQPQVKRFRTGTAVVTLDNTGGWFVPGSEDTPGLLALRPGRWMRIQARGFSARPPSSTPIPDGTTWTDSTGRTWTSHGADMTLEDPGEPTPDWVPIWQGRIDTIDNRHISGDLTAIVRCTDLFASLATNNTVAQTPAGAGETTTQRMNRILDYYQIPEDWRDVAANGTNTVEAIDFARDALTNVQQTAEAEGGAVWSSADGKVTFRSSDWKSTTVDWFFGGVTGIPMRTVTPSWSLFNIVNSVAYSRAGGTVQTADDAVSQAKYGRRTHQRLDFVNDNDPAVLLLAQATLLELADVREYVQEASVLVQDDVTVDFVLNVQIGDLVQITVDTIHGWSVTTLGTIVAISDEIGPEGWVMTLGFADATPTNVDGPYDYQEFSRAFHLGGHP